MTGEFVTIMDIDEARGIFDSFVQHAKLCTDDTERVAQSHLDEFLNRTSVEYLAGAINDYIRSKVIPDISDDRASGLLRQSINDTIYKLAGVLRTKLRDGSRRTLSDICAQPALLLEGAHKELSELFAKYNQFAERLGGDVLSYGDSGCGSDYPSMVTDVSDALTGKKLVTPADSSFVERYAYSVITGGDPVGEMIDHSLADVFGRSRGVFSGPLFYDLSQGMDFMPHFAARSVRVSISYHGLFESDGLVLILRHNISRTGRGTR